MPAEIEMNDTYDTVCTQYIIYNIKLIQPMLLQRG